MEGKEMRSEDKKFRGFANKKAKNVKDAKRKNGRLGRSPGKTAGKIIANREKWRKEQLISYPLVSTRRGFFCVLGYLAYSAT